MDNSFIFFIHIGRDSSISKTKENIVYLAKQAENASFRSLWVLERLLWPINPQNPYPGTRDGKFPDDWQYIFDPLETLIFVAANTSKITLGTS
jgi:alkanesulfonate monooxygenase SsuD/methylene tetrahydromethanopterin reductase-like flavin-dependent oxidoreductase (luciferase family)